MTLKKIALALALVGVAGTASAADLWVLSSDNKLAKFSTDSKEVSGTWDIKGTKTPLRGIDVRPANGQLYAVGDDNVIYTVDTATATATAGPKLSVALPGKGRAVVGFYPVADRLRVV